MLRSLNVTALFHSFSLDVLDYARENGVEIIGFPSNATHILQPADLSVFGPMKHYASLARAAFAQRGIISRSNIVRVLSHAILAAASPQNIVSGWTRAGLVPFNPQAVLDRKTHDGSAVAEKDGEKGRARAERQSKKREEKESAGGGVSLTLIDGEEVQVPYDFSAFIDTVSLQPNSLNPQQASSMDPLDSFFGQWVEMGAQSSLSLDPASILAVPGALPRPQRERKGLPQCKFSRVLTSDAMNVALKQIQAHKSEKTESKQKRAGERKEKKEKKAAEKEAKAQVKLKRQRERKEATERKEKEKQKKREAKAKSGGAGARGRGRVRKRGRVGARGLVDADGERGDGGAVAPEAERKAKPENEPESGDVHRDSAGPVRKRKRASSAASGSEGESAGSDGDSGRSEEDAHSNTDEDPESDSDSQSEGEAETASAKAERKQKERESREEAMLLEPGHYVVIQLLVDLVNSRPFGLGRVVSEVDDKGFVGVQPYLPVDMRKLFEGYRASDDGTQPVSARSLLWHVSDDDMDVDDKTPGMVYLPENVCASLKAEYKL